MADTDAKRGKINELLDHIESRLNELEEKEELKKFQEKDKERRCLEYALYQRELEQVAETLLEVEEDRRADVHGANVQREKYNERQKEIQDLKESIADTRHSLEAVAQGRRDTQAELTDFIRSRTERECIVEDLRMATKSTGGRREDFEAELQQLETKTTEKEAPDARLDALFAKQGRATRFRTKSERDTFLRHGIASVTAYKTDRDTALESTNADLVTARRSLGELKTLARDGKGKVEDGRRRAKEPSEESTKKEEEQADLVEKRKELWREDTKLDSPVSRAADELKTAESNLAGMMDKHMEQALKAVDSIAERYNPGGVCDPLYRPFEVVDPKLNMAVELTAGNSLFHVVVDTASKALDVMLKEKNDRVTSMPLNRLKNPPAPNSQDVKPLIDQLRFGRKYEKQVFGKTCVCRDLSITAAYVKSHSINTITLDGDKVDRKGALTGGYHDVRRSRIEAIKSVRTWRAKYDAEKTRSQEVKDSIRTLEGDHTEKEIARLETEEEELETELRSLDAKIMSYSSELGTPLTNTITAEEEALIVSLGKETERRRKEMLELSRSKNELEGRKNTLEIELKERLQRQREEVKLKLETLEELSDDSTSANDLEARTRELRTLNNFI
ncbi:unnamed protein product [Cyclocybe aegerita]|uniref:SMC hinge domain-containing protein n=1 Tax=Cyclocybe aegerita TaxID=1973307 RepID=A0A8S0VXB7_CYCAE|nr:unnamed protein product [Cyclocybe aegerita]